MKCYYHKDNGDIIEHIVVFNDDDTPSGFYVAMEDRYDHSMYTSNYTEIRKRVGGGKWLYYPADKLCESDVKECFVILKSHKKISKADLFLMML